jgi:ABC-2 type transport system ATP-binding protein
VWELIRSMQANGQTVILTTHSMEEAETLCDRVAIIDRGQVIACDTPAALVTGLGASSRITLPLYFSCDEVQALPGAGSAQIDGARLTIETNDPLATLVQLYDLAQRRKVNMAEMSLRQPNLEDVFLQLAGRPLQAGEGVKE